MELVLEVMACLELATQVKSAAFEMEPRLEIVPMVLVSVVDVSRAISK